MSYTRDQLIEEACKQLMRMDGMDPLMPIKMPAPQGYEGLVDSRGQITVQAWNCCAVEIQKYLKMTEAVRRAQHALTPKETVQ